MKRPILDSLNSLPYFTIESVKQLWGAESTSDATIRTAVYRWAKAGQLIQLKKGVYMPRRFHDRHAGDEDFTPTVSSILLPQSYLSLEFVLQRHQILTEITYPVTAVTLKNTRTIENRLGTFWYRNLQPSLYRGYEISEYYGIPFAMASLAKALFDYLYLRPWTGEFPARGFSLAEDLRLNLDEFTEEERNEFAGYVDISHSSKMNDIWTNLRKSTWRP